MRIFGRRRRRKKIPGKLSRIFKRRKRARKKPVKLSIAKHKGTAVIAISGDFNTATTPYLQKMCQKVINDETVGRVVLDFKKVQKVDTSAFACILNFMRENIQENKTICAMNVSKLKKDYLKMLRLDKTIKIVRK